ncbi:hypothetical protein A2715_05030 [Candidatus Woesebacteria bacterium RIFCSPHIGHO2_01_FULL_39_32]|uniref:Membrane protein 6-pyruvoyl-tetrahydropterin synthase-related domain-containing protein n=1 Tax=Candidatus Woesebacteria bacterium RIFCSPLOWO2_01_FULL_39_25 TaxID=1802521 RepID=A0A1F8BLJ5_9BACT|nr:MAG: hypothetical protein A2715_05030 [Candidatus Woesebacteria bacterium RIFCSPHIGHO2_01_FULL_39_32]OGM38488.1 MAG: hypothetical protein A3F01_03985 [Candidatus Woesebacteria bacterium RIFCSPHIGHO2_12_FULL_38_11]OGM64913.1 MAG: hypothetical protein A2893_04640 [Candidatus Woesebacteria bacterium RIFCSPLOWO2_01_FULL_39_25]
MNKKIFILLLLSSVLLTTILFKDKTILGGGESGVPFYNITRMFKDSSSSWLDGLLGSYIPQSVANYPYLKIFSFLEVQGINGYVLQALFTFIALLISLVFFFLLTKEVFSNYPNSAYLFSSFFYLFNFYSAMNIWNRFLLNFLLFYSVLPMFLWLYMRFLRSRNFVYLGLFLMLSFIFSYAFSSPGHIMIFWFLLLFISLFELMKDKKKVAQVKNFVITLMLWLLVNFWWILQQAAYAISESFKSISTEYFSDVGNTIGFSFLSNVLGKFENLYLLKHGLFYNQEYDFILKWPLIYKKPLLLIVEWMASLYILYWAINNRKRLSVVFSLGLLLIGFILAKGNSPPLGEVFDFFFQRFSFVQFFRNPFEKLGIIPTMGFSLMIGPSLSDLAKKLSRQKPFLRVFIPLVSFTYIVVILGFPFWSGLVFTGSQAPLNDPEVGLRVEVPSYYKDADNWLSLEDKDTRFMTFPLGGEGIQYLWPKGYLGVEESAILFENANISSVLAFPYYDKIASNLQKLFTKNIDFYKIASLLNARYLLFRPDIEFKNSGMKDPAYIDNLFEERVSNEKANISFASQFGPLKFYKLDNKVTLPKIYAANNYVNGGSGADIEQFLLSGAEVGDVMYNSGWPVRNKLDANTSFYVSKNKAIFYLPGPQYPLFVDAPYIFPYVSHLPSSPIYSLLIIKENLQRNLYSDKESKLRWDLLTLGKRLIEVRNALSAGDEKGAIKSLQIYRKNLASVVSDIDLVSKSLKKPGEQVWNEKMLTEIFSSHLFLFNDFEKSTLNSDGSITDLKKQLLLSVSKLKILPYYYPIVSEDFPLESRVVYGVEIDSSGEYDVIFPKSIFFPEYFGINQRINIQIDDVVYSTQIGIDNNKVYFGKYYLSEGYHEISFNQFSKINLIDENLTSFELNSIHGEDSINIPIKTYDAYSQYEISFDYLIHYGNGPVLQVSLNNDKIIKKDGVETEQYYFEKYLPPDDYYFIKRPYSTVVNPDPSSDTMTLIFSAIPWNNCTKIFYKNPKKCSDVSISKTYERPTKVEITNLQIHPRFSRELFVLRVDAVDEKVSPKISFTKKSHTHYKVEVRDSEKPFVLVFSELFDKGWKLYLNGDSKRYPENNHFLANSYANGWLIENEGDFNLELKFVPDKFKEMGLYLSFFVLGLIFLITLLLSVNVFLSKRFNKGL